MRLYNVRDVRNGNRLGPYPQAEARTLAADLNDFVRRNAGITRPPFTVEPA